MQQNLSKKLFTFQRYLDFLLLLKVTLLSLLPKCIPAQYIKLLGIFLLLKASWLVKG